MNSPSMQYSSAVSENPINRRNGRLPGASGRLFQTPRFRNATLCGILQRRASVRDGKAARTRRVGYRGGVPVIIEPGSRPADNPLQLGSVRFWREAHGNAPSVSAFAGVTPGLVPVLARGIDDATVGLEELVGELEDREHQPPLGAPCDVPAALLAPDEFASFALDALRRSFLVDQAALEDVGLLDVDVLVIG